MPWALGVSLYQEVDFIKEIDIEARNNQTSSKSLHRIYLDD